MGNEAALKQKAEQCLAEKTDIPSSPLWHMGMAAGVGMKKPPEWVKPDKHLNIMQDAIDYLTCKAKAKMAFSSRDKEFLIELFEAMGWGGEYKGYKEAAQLVRHYVHGEGKPLRINPGMYQQAPIVQATMVAMKQFIAEQKKSGRPFVNIRSNHPQFSNGKYAVKLRKMRSSTEGLMKFDGVLEAPQHNHRLHKADGHFYLDSFNTDRGRGIIYTRWSINSLYDFEPFEKQDYYTNIPLTADKNLKLPDGLSEYMTRIGIAKTFNYSAEWTETWTVSP